MTDKASMDTNSGSKTANDTSNVNIMSSGSSSKPARFGSFKSHGHNTNKETSMLISNPSSAVSSQQHQQQMISVPSAATITNNNELNAVSNVSTSINIGTGDGSECVGLGQSGYISSSVTPPSSAGLRQTGPIAFETKFLRRTSSLRILMPKLSTDSISFSPGSTLSGQTNWAIDNRDKSDGNQTDKSATETTKLNRKESYKAQRKNYRREKKRVASELLNSLQDPAVIVLADWLKVRGTLKSWTKLWCVLKPGHLLLYKSPKTKSSHWVGTILLTSCHVIERPSKKDGFCFKLFHPLEQSIWAPRGPDKETIGAVVQPLPTSYLIFRAPSQAAGKCWMDALELSLRCSGLLLRSNSTSTNAQTNSATEGSISHETQWSEADYEKHFNDQDIIKYWRNKSKYLMVPNAELIRSSGSSDISEFTSPSQTPILQQLYNAMTNWEQVVTANIPELKKLKVKQNFDDNVRDMKQTSCPISSSMNRLNKSVITSQTEDATAITSNMDSGSLPLITLRPVSAPPDLDNDSQNEAVTGVLSGVDTDTDSDINDVRTGDNQMEDSTDDEQSETTYVPCVEGEFIGGSGEQVEVLGEENKSLIWCLLKQVRPGMDLSKVVLPTFILEPRSFLDKLSDSYYHVDILSKAVCEDDPFTRMKLVAQWYLSGFYKKPKGLKKPYNPILGETFRCYWQHPNGSRTFYIAEQVSHHPPISAFYVTNRQEGFSISCSILAKSKFYGNSTSAVLDGEATLTLLPRGESYSLTTPYAHCKGILMGTLSMEYGGKVNIDCENTGYKTELEFKLKPFLGNAEHTNVVVGKIKLIKEPLATITGRWDSEMRIKDCKTGEETVLFTVNKDVAKTRLTRYLVPLDYQLPNESERLWQLVSEAIKKDDQVGATKEKTILEDSQRNAAKERKTRFVEWEPQHFQQDILTGKWMYKYADLRPWDPRTDVKQYEVNYKVLTKTRHLAPTVRTASIVNIDAINVKRVADRATSSVSILKNTRIQNPRLVNDIPRSDSSQSEEEIINDNTGIGAGLSQKAVNKLMLTVEKTNKTLEEHTRQLMVINAKLERIQFAPTSRISNSQESQTSLRATLTNVATQSIIMRISMYVMAAIVTTYFLKWLLN